MVVVTDLPSVEVEVDEVDDFLLQDVTTSYSWNFGWLPVVRS